MRWRFRFSAALMCVMAATESAAQPGQPEVRPRDSVTVTAGAHYEGGAVRRLLLGDTYRDLWTTPIRVPVLHLSTYAGGVRPTGVGGGSSTLSLRLENDQGREFVFRLVDKSRLSTPPFLRGTFVDRIFRDQVSALHPAGAMVSAPIMTAGGTLHPEPVLAFMPDDPLLGEYRDDFANTLGMIEEFPDVPENAHRGFAGTYEVISSDDLLELLNTDPMHRVDGRAMLKARLIDILVSDNDRHPGQFRWARTSEVPPYRWVPIARDRDHAFVHFDGALIRFARRALSPTLILFEGSDMNLEALTEHRGFDARMLSALEKPVWDSVIDELHREITDSVIDAAVGAQPPEFLASAPHLAASLKERRRNLAQAAHEWYAGMAVAPDIHATDAPERAIITRVDDRFVAVRIETLDGIPYYERRFDARETDEIRVFLHGGDDHAIVRGSVRSSIQLRIVGGNGNNSLVDSSTVRGLQLARIYDQGETEGVSYGEDTLFNRKPFMNVTGTMQARGPDRGARVVPRLGLTRQSNLGATPLIGFTKYYYNFEHHPYAAKVGFEAEYATELGGWRFLVEGDRRLERSPIHLTASAGMSDLEVVTHRGLGNMLTAEGASSEFFDVRHRQWFARPAVALTIGRKSDVSIGPVFQYSTTDSVPDRFISEVRPYGFPGFAQLGARISVHVGLEAGIRPPIERDGFPTVTPKPLHRFAFQLEATHYPALLDVRTPFQTLAASGAAHVTFPAPFTPELVMRGGGRAVFGEFPFHEAAFIGRRNAARSVDFQTYEGDASLFGSAELRLKTTKFMFVLPLEGGPLLLGDASRVFVDGSSPGGWHTAVGGGIWLGVRDTPLIFTFTFVNEGGLTRFGTRSGLKF